MNRDKLKVLYKEYDLTEEDVFKHKHYLIITRSGIEKIQVKSDIKLTYEVVRCEKDFASIKAIATKDSKKVETFGSALYGAKVWDEAKKKWNEKGNTTTHYIIEMAEKRAMSRAVLKLTGFYELGVFGEDEAEDFKKPKS
jgi:hypothetical protein